MEGKMSENETSPVGQDVQNPVGESISNPDADTQAPVGAPEAVKQGQSKPEGDWVKYENHRKTLNDKARWRERAEAAERERDELKRVKLEETQNYKALYENEKEHRERIQAEKAELDGVVTNGIKYHAVKQAIESRGLKCRDYDVLFQVGNTDLLQTEDGEHVEGVEQFIEHANERFNYLFDTGSIPRTNDAPPTYQPDKPITKQNFNQLSTEEQQQQLAAANKAQQGAGVLTSNSPR
jgi:hypothetical protein